MQLLSWTTTHHSDKFSSITPMKFRKYEISLSDQHATNPQQTINEVTKALRPAAFMLELPVALTCSTHLRQHQQIDDF